jgi:universal stress protein family protein
MKNKPLIQRVLFERLATESYPMDQWLGLSSDRYGHQITLGGGVSSKITSFEVSHSAGPESEEPPAHDLIIQNAAGRSPIRRILIPIDAVHVKPLDLKPILNLAQHIDAEVTLLHCYEIPLSFHYAVGWSALMDVSLHREMVRTRLLKLCADVRKFFTRCRSEFALGSLPVEILYASRSLQTDLIAVPLALDFGSYSWTTKEIMDELVRKANCPVVGIPFQIERVGRFNTTSRGFNINMKILETERSSTKLVSIKKVIVAIDLTKHSEATTHYAAQIAKWFNASLCIAREGRELCARLNELTEQAHQLVPMCESVCLEGDPVEQIPALARDLGADLIVIASHHPSFFARLFNLDKAPKIMHRAHCPVLVFHQGNT